MKITTLLPILVGAIAVLVALNWGSLRAKEPPKPKYLVAEATLPANQPVRSLFIGTREWTKSDKLPDDYLTETTVLRGRFVRRQIEKGEPITEDDLWPFGVTSAMMAKLTSDPTMRGVPVKVDSVSGGGGFVKPGDCVDVAAVGNLVDDPMGLRAKRILQGVEVLAVNQRDSVATEGSQTKGKKKQPQQEKLRHVVLLLSAVQADRLLAVQSLRSVKIQLILAGKDAKRIETPGATVRDALGLGESAAPPAQAKSLPAAEPAQPPKRPPQPDRHVVEVRRGGERETLKFDLKGDSWVPSSSEKEQEGGKEGGKAGGSSSRSNAAESDQFQSVEE